MHRDSQKECITGGVVPPPPLQKQRCMRCFFRFGSGIPSHFPLDAPRRSPGGHADSASLHRVPPGRRIAPPSRHGADAPSLRSK